MGFGILYLGFSNKVRVNVGLALGLGSFLVLGFGAKDLSCIICGLDLNVRVSVFWDLCLGFRV